MPAVTIGNAAERCTLAEAVRAAILTVHAAAGLASGADPQTQRLLRASEGLSRSALAVLLASPPGTSPQRAPRPLDAPRRRRPRGKRSRGQKATAMEEDGTEKPEPSEDAPAVNRVAAATASGPAAVEMLSSCPDSCSGSVPKKARAPLLLQPVVGHAGAFEVLDDVAWADSLPEVRRPLSLDAKRAKLGRCSEDKAGVSLASNPPTASASSGVVQVSPLAASDYPASGFVNAWYRGGGGFAGTYAFILSDEETDCTVWQDTKDSTRLCARDAATGNGWIYGNPEGKGAPNRLPLDVYETRSSPSTRTWRTCWSLWSSSWWFTVVSSFTVVARVRCMWLNFMRILQSQVSCVVCVVLFSAASRGI